MQDVDEHDQLASRELLDAHQVPESAAKVVVPEAIDPREIRLEDIETLGPSDEAILVVAERVFVEFGLGLDEIIGKAADDVQLVGEHLYLWQLTAPAQRAVFGEIMGRLGLLG